MRTISQSTHNIMPRTPWPLLGAAFASLLMCTASYAQMQPQPKQRAAAPAAATPTRPAPPSAAAPATSATASATPRAGGDIVARVAGRDITTTEVRGFIAGLGAREQVALARDPALLSQAVRLMLANQLVLKEAETKKWQDKPEVAVQLERVRDGAIAETYLQAVSIPPESYPDQADVQKAYDANKTAFVVPRQFHIAQIFVSLANGADKDAEEKARKKLAELQAKLKQPKADFAAVAKETSDQQDTAERGGELGWVPETQIRPEIKTQVMGLANNAVTEPIKLDDGWHIIKLLETKPSETRPLADVRNAIVSQLRAQRAEALRRAYLAKLLEQTPPAINELALTKIFENPADKAVTR